MANYGGQIGNGGGNDSSLTRRSALLRVGVFAGGLTVLPGALAACGDDDDDGGDGSGSNASGGSKPAALVENQPVLSSFKPYDPDVAPGGNTGLPKKIATNFPAGSAYFDNFRDNVEKAAKARGFKFSSTQWETDLAQNIAQLKQLQQTGVGAVIAQVQDEPGEAATLKGIIEDGICVVYSVAGPSTLQIIADQYAGGRTQGEQAAKWIKENLNGEAQVVSFNDDQIAEALIPRGKGRIDGVKTAGSGVEIVANQGIKQLTAEEGNKMAQTILQAHPDANVWIADDDTAIGVVSALEAAGKKSSDKIYVSGFNGQRNALEAVKSGGLFREDIAFPNAVYEYTVGQFACDWIEGKSIPSVMELKVQIADASTVDALLADDADPTASFESNLEKFVVLYGNTSYSKPNFTPTGIKGEDG